MGNSGQARQVLLEAFESPWEETDKDANFKQQVAMYSKVDPMPTVDRMSHNLDIPVGAIVRFVLGKWAASGSEALLEMGPRVVRNMAEIVGKAESAGTDEARLSAYQSLSQIISWLNVPLTDPEWRPWGSQD